MKYQVLFFITAEFPFGTGETFIENEIGFLAGSFDKVIILPLKKSSLEHRLIPPNVLVRPLQSRHIRWLEVAGKILGNREIIGEFLNNMLSNPLKNKILLKGIQAGLNITTYLEELKEEYRFDEKFYYSYWLDDGAIGIAFLNDRQSASRAHGWDVYFERHPYNYLPLRKFLTSKLGQIFAISDNGRIYIQNKTNQYKKVKLSRLGTINKYALKDEIDDTHLNIISISNVIPLKRISLIGEAIQSISINQISWHHYGDGILIDQMREKFPFANFHGRFANADIKHILNRFSSNSILINTSTSEGIPVSMMEAMSFGIPCIGTNVGGVSEIIEDNVNGFLMPANPTPETVSSYIQKYFDLSTKNKKKFRMSAFNTWKEKFNAVENYRCFVSEIKSLSYNSCD